ncbi:MAG: exosome complex RNA-binding protein Rrp4 [Candidatus Nanoarchaeia archaeon]
MSNEEKRKIVTPGETLVKGEEYLPGDNAERDGEEIIANRYGLLDIQDKLVKVIPLSGVYMPRRGNTIIGQVAGLTFNGWLIDYGGAGNGFLPVSEIPQYVGKGELKEHFDFGDVLVAKVSDASGKSLDLTVKGRGLGKLDEGMLIKINPHKVPRVIGREGSMVKLIKEATGCNIVVGQNGWVWIRGDSIDDEVKTDKIIRFICNHSFISGLTERVEEYIGELNGKE